MLPWAAMLPSVLGTVGEAIKKAIPDRDLAKKLEAEVTQQLLRQDNTEFQGKVDIIMAEANSEGMLARNWRPITMLTFTALVTFHWLGFTPDNLSQESINMLLEIVKVGLGGYVIGRSAEKAAKAWKS